MILAEALSSWVLTTNQTPGTIHRYTRGVAMLAAHGIVTTLDLTPGRYGDYQDARTRAGIKASTLNVELAGACVALDWLRRRGRATLEQLLTLRAMRLRRPTPPPPDYYDGDEFSAVRRAAWRRASWAGLAFEIACYTGVRKGELRRLEVEDFDFNKKLLHVRRKTAELGPAGDTKGHRDRSVSLAPEAIDLVRQFGPLRGPLFPSRPPAKTRFRRQEPFDLLALRVSEETGVHVTWHRCRRTFTTRALIAGVPPSEVAAMLGHVGLNVMMARYRAWISRYEPAVERMSFRPESEARRPA